jgi:hypothetical protein
VVRAGWCRQTEDKNPVGYDNVDVAACVRRGVAVGNTPGVLTETTADLAWTLLMAAARRLPEGDRYVRAGQWRTWGPMLLLGPDVHGATVGIVGFGRIGQAVARRAKGFGIEILYHDVARVPDEVAEPLGATYVSLEELLARSDFVTLHVNLTAETRHLINASTLAAMKPTAVLVNTSRGPVVDQVALDERPARWHDLGGRPGRHGSRTDPGGRSPGRPRQLPDRAAHRVGLAGDPRQDGRDGRGQPARRRPGRVTAHAGRPARSLA